jgi:hypothetical protein
LLDQVIWVRSEGKWAREYLDQGWFWVHDVPTDRPATIRVAVPGVGSCSRTAVGGDQDCVFQMDAKGWGLLEAEAPALVVDKWINHAAMTWEQLRGRIVLLTFRDLRRDSEEELSWWRQCQSAGLVVIAVYDHVPANGSVSPDDAVSRIVSLFQGVPMAGCLDADPALVADLMPKGDPGDAFAGATHSLYQVSVRPTTFLIDRAGRIRGCVDENTVQERIEMLLQE